MLVGKVVYTDTRKPVKAKDLVETKESKHLVVLTPSTGRYGHNLVVKNKDGEAFEIRYDQFKNMSLK